MAGCAAATRLALATVLLCAACSCASWPRRETPPLAPPPDATFITAEDGTRLYTALDGPSSRSVVWFVLGPELTAAPPVPRLAAALHDAGFATAVLHPRGSGYSDGVRGDADSARFLGDYRGFLATLQARFEQVFLFGQSVGAAFTLELAARSPLLGGVVLVNPAWKLQTSTGMTPTFGDYLSFIGNFLFRPAALTVDMNSRPEAVEFPADREEALAMQRDPLVVRYFSMRYLSAQRAVMDRCPQNVAASTAPLLLVQGAHDALVEPESLDALLAKAGALDKQKLVAPEGGHGSSAVETQVPALIEWFVTRRR